MPATDQTTANKRTENLTEKKLKLINAAREVLRGDRNLSSELLEQMYKKLEHDNQFAYATEVLLVKMKMDEENCQTLRLNDYHKLALYIYKDHSLSSQFKFKKALQQLQNHEDMAKTLNCESLGLAAAVYKRKWQFDHQFKNLILSRYYYKRGYSSWLEYLAKPVKGQEDIQNDDGYTGINYAYILELMAVDKLEEHGEITGSSENIDLYFKVAAKTRQDILAVFLDDINLPQPVMKVTGYKNWVLATIAEAYFGLRKYDQAQFFIKKYITEFENQDWEIKSFNQQLISLAYLQGARKKFYEAYPSDNEQEYETNKKISNEIDTQKIYECLDLFSGKENKNKMDIKKAGKLGLALSGGGFRASLFQIGVLAALAEKDELRNIEVLSCVSGGSIIGAYYYIKLKMLLEKNTDDEIKRDSYIKLVQEIEKDFLSDIQNNLRVRIFSDPVSNIKMLWKKNYSRTHRLGELYEKFLYKKIWKEYIDWKNSELKEDKKGEKEKNELSEDEKFLCMSNLLIKPKGEAENFDIANDNWKRRNKVPQLILNATSVNTGHNWQFTASWMGEPPGNIQTNIDVKPRLRRMYYSEAPGEYKKFKLGFAVGASSCVPVMFHPMPMFDLYPEIDLQLVDGGLHDNQGIAALIEQECNNMIISDGSGQLPTNKVATNNEAAVFYRTDNILQERLRELQFMDLSERNYTTQLNQLITVHLKNDLPQNPISWNFCIDPARTILYANPSIDKNRLTKYGVLKSSQILLSEIRTDLDSFSNTEAYALMYSGYLQTHYEYNNNEKKIQPEIKEEIKDDVKIGEESLWKFSEIKEFVTIPVQAERVRMVLKTGSKQFFKILDLSDAIKSIAQGIAAAALLLLIGFVYSNWDSQVTDIKVGSVFFILIVFIIARFSKTIGYLINSTGTLKKWVILFGLAIFGFLASVIYLSFLNTLYNWIGRIKKK